MRKVFLDTNVIVDFLEQRGAFATLAKEVFSGALEGKYNLLLSDLTIANIRYITRKSIPLEQFYQFVHALRAAVSIVGIGQKGVDEAVRMQWRDFEDALQYSAALQVHADCIITRNVRDFENPALEVLTPQEFLKKYL